MAGRSPDATPDRRWVTRGGGGRLLAMAGVPLLLLGMWGPVAAQESSLDATAHLRRAARRDLPLATRLGHVDAALAAEVPGDAEAALDAAAALAPDALESACWLLWHGRRHQEPHGDVRARLLHAFRVRPEEEGDARTLRAAARFALGERPEGCEAILVPLEGTPHAFVVAVIRADAGPDVLGSDVLASDGRATEGGAGVRERLAARLVHVRALDAASVDDPTVSGPALDGLLANLDAAAPLLRHEVRVAGDRFQAGRRGRAARAILVLGMGRDRASLPLLVGVLEGTDGWLRVQAAVALGDLGDPVAIFPLVRQMTLLGDPLRHRDQWEYPGPANTTVAEGDWQRASYFAIDAAAADSLLRLGVPGAAGWLVHQLLDPRKKRFRIRVLQDSTDALARAFPTLPSPAYNVEAGLPQREAAFRALVTWWHGRGGAHPEMPDSVDDTHPGVRQATLALADVLSGEQGVREMMMAKAAVQVLGPLMIPALTDRAHNARSPLHRAEVAQSLGLVGDARAVDPLIHLLRDPALFVRAKAVEGLGPYARQDPRVEPLLLRLLQSGHAALRVPAMQGLVHAAPSDTVRQALATWETQDGKRVAAGQPSWRSPEVARALVVVRLVQEGDAHLEAVQAGLADPQRVIRRTWWDLVRGALDLPDPWNNPVAEPDDPHARHVDASTLRAALGRVRKEVGHGD